MLASCRGRAWARAGGPARRLAILTQPPLFSKADLQREAQLRRQIELAERTQRHHDAEAARAPQFREIARPEGVLATYMQQRARLSPRDAAAAFYALGSRLRVPAGTRRRRFEHAGLQVLVDDVAAAVPALRSWELANVLLGAAYMQLRDDALVAPVCEHAALKTPQFSLRGVASSLYALGRLERRDAALLPALLSRIEAEAAQLHAVEMAHAASGLAGLYVAPPALLGALASAAVEKIDQFGALEMPMLLSGLASLSWHDERLLGAAASQLPVVLPDAGPRALAQLAAAYAAAKAWIPPALEQLGSHAAATAGEFSAAEASAALGAFGALRWDQPAASRALGRRLAALAPWAHANEIAVGLDALTRLPGAAEDDTLSTLLRASRHVALPELGTPPSEEAVGALAMLCNALRHHGVRPHAALLGRLRELRGTRDVDEPAGAEPTDRRRIAQLMDALRHWEGEGGIQTEQTGRPSLRAR